MKFLYPQFLYALTAILIPIIIHLFNFRKFKTVYFSNVRFLKDIKKETKAHSQLKHLLILLSRILAISALVFAFAQPYIPVNNTIIHDKYAVSIYIDNSFSMNAENENGHISPVWYSVLARNGYFPVSELSTFRKIDSRLQGHPTTHEKLPGIRVASGSLGQGLSVAIGSAETKKLNNDKKIIYTLHGDGELQEGQIWEAAMYASAKNSLQ